MEVKRVGEKWYAKKNDDAVTWEDVTDIVKIENDFMSVMGKAGRTRFHSYLGRQGSDWVEMSGVTSLLEYWGEKRKLTQWAVDKAVEYINEKRSHSKDILDGARFAHLNALKDAGDKGTDVHAEIEVYITDAIRNNSGVPLSLKDPHPVEQANEFTQWATGNGVIFHASEMPVYSRNMWTAGTMDFLCEIDGKKFIGDVKTSNYVNYKHFVQCGAYALMLEELTDEKVEGLVIVQVPRTGGMNVYFDNDVDGYKEDFKSLVSLVRRDKKKSRDLGYK